MSQKNLEGIHDHPYKLERPLMIVCPMCNGDTHLYRAHNSYGAPIVISVCQNQFCQAKLEIHEYGVDPDDDEPMCCTNPECGWVGSVDNCETKEGKEDLDEACCPECGSDVE